MSSSQSVVVRRKSSAYAAEEHFKRRLSVKTSPQLISKLTIFSAKPSQVAGGT